MPALAHRLIVKTAATVRDVDAVLIVRELLDSVPIESRSAQAPSVRRSSQPSAALVPTPMLRRIQVLVLAGVLLIAALSTGAPFLFFLVYLSILVVGGSYVVTRFGLADLEAGYVLDRVHAQAGDMLRASYTVRNTSRLPKFWLEVHNPTSLPVPLARPGDHARAARRTVVVGPRPADAAGPLPRRAAGVAHRRSARAVRIARDGGQPRDGHRLPARRVAARLAAAAGVDRGLARAGAADAAHDAARDVDPAVRAG